MHMFSIFAVKVPPFPVHRHSFLPTKEDITVIQGDLEVLVSRILCDYIKGLVTTPTMKRWQQSRSCTTTKL